MSLHPESSQRCRGQHVRQDIGVRRRLAFGPESGGDGTKQWWSKGCSGLDFLMKKVASNFSALAQKGFGENTESLEKTPRNQEQNVDASIKQDERMLQIYPILT